MTIDTQDTRRGIGGVGFGVALIVVGGLWLLAETTGIDILSLAWPLFIVIPGVVLLLAGLGARNGLVVAGTIVTTVGLILWYQAITDHYESWAYAWALVGPTAGGVGGWLLGRIRDDEGQQREGRTAARTGLVLFVIGLVFFEGVIGISGRDWGTFGDILVPALVIAFGAYLLMRGRLRDS